MIIMLSPDLGTQIHLDGQRMVFLSEKGIHRIREFNELMGFPIHRLGVSAIPVCFDSNKKVNFALGLVSYRGAEEWMPYTMYKLNGDWFRCDCIILECERCSCRSRAIDVSCAELYWIYIGAESAKKRAYSMSPAPCPGCGNISDRRYVLAWFPPEIEELDRD